MLIFAITAFWLISDVLTFAKFVEFLKRSTVKGDSIFLFSSTKICLMLKFKWNSADICYIFCKRKPFWQLNTHQPTLPLVAMKTFVHERLTNLLHRSLKCTFWKENLLRKKMKNLLKKIFANICWNFAE